MELLPEQRTWYWARVGAIGIALVLTFVAVVVVAAVGVLLYLVGSSDANWDTDNLPIAKRLELTEHTLATFPFLRHIEGAQNLQIRRVTPGSYGYYFVSYSVDPDRVPNVVAAWRDRDDAVEADIGPIDRSDRSPPAWWPEGGANVLGVTRLGPQAELEVDGVYVWCNQSNGTFYVFFSWGH